MGNLNISKHCDNSYVAIDYIDNSLVEIIAKQNIEVKYNKKSFVFDYMDTKDKVISKFNNEKIGEFFDKVKNYISVECKKIIAPKIDKKILKDMFAFRLEDGQTFSYSYCPSFNINDLRVNIIFYRKISPELKIDRDFYKIRVRNIKKNTFSQRILYTQNPIKSFFDFKYYLNNNTIIKEKEEILIYQAFHQALKEYNSKENEMIISNLFDFFMGV